MDGKEALITFLYSVVIPIYNEAEVLPTLYHRLTQVMERCGEPYEIIFVNDGSTDDSPMLLWQLSAQWRAGYDIVFAVRQSRRWEGIFKRGTASLFYRLLQRLTATEIPLDAGDFRLMSRRAVEALRPIRERNRFVRGLVGWIGFRHTSVTFVRDVRHAGETKYPLSKMASFAFILNRYTRRLRGSCT